MKNKAKKPTVSVENICSPDHPGQSPSACCSLLGREGSQEEAGTGPREGAGKSDSMMETSLLTSSAPQGDPWLQPVCLGELSCSSLSSQLQPDRDTWAGRGTCQWRWAAAAQRRQSDCVLSLNHPHHSPKHVSPSIAIPVSAAGTCVFP